MNKLRLVNWLLALVLVTGPVQSALAEAHGVNHDPHHAVAVSEVAEHAHATQPDVAADQGYVHGHDKVHNHNLCGAQCFAALIYTYSLNTQVSSPTHHVTHPIALGIILSPDSKPPRLL